MLCSVWRATMSVCQCVMISQGEKWFQAFIRFANDLHNVHFIKLEVIRIVNDMYILTFEYCQFCSILLYKATDLVFFYNYMQSYQMDVHINVNNILINYIKLLTDFKLISFLIQTVILIKAFVCIFKIKNSPLWAPDRISHCVVGRHNLCWALLATVRAI